MCLQDEVLVLQGKRMSSEQSEVRMQFAGRSEARCECSLQDEAKRKSACFTHEERAERVLNVLAGRSPCFTRKMHEQRAERVLNVFAGRAKRS